MSECVVCGMPLTICEACLRDQAVAQPVIDAAVGIATANLKAELAETLMALAYLKREHQALEDRAGRSGLAVIPVYPLDFANEEA